jgi:hypothetical protein
MRKPALATHAQNFAAICRASIEKTPCLEDFLAGKNIPASVIQIGITPQKDRPKARYLGAYDVIDATDYGICLRRVGDKVEVIGRIAEIKVDKARNGKPYIFINFGPWQGQIFKISIWSEGLAAITKKPDDSWVGKWISVVGLMEPPYVSRRYKYSHLSINVTANGQMTVIAEAEAKFRLAPSSAQASIATSSNKGALDKIKGRTTFTPQPKQAPVIPSANKSVLDNIRKAQGGAQSRQTQAPPHSARHQKPPEKGLLEKVFDWIFK